MKPQSLLVAVVLLLLVAGGLVFSGLFTADSAYQEATEDARPAAAPDETAAEVTAPKLEATPTKTEVPAQPEPTATREVVKNENVGTSTVSGLVTDKAGNGVPNAEVVFYFGPSNPAFKAIGARRPAGFAAVTGSDGSYTIENIGPADNYLAIATHPDYAQGERYGIAVKDGDYSLVGPIVLTSGSKLLGRVTAQTTQAPIAGAKVELWDMLASNFLDPAQRKPWRETTTDADGRYEFKNVHFPSFEIVAQAPELATQARRVTQILLSAPPEGDQVFDFELMPASAIRGAVVDARGAAIAGARVDAEQINQPANAGLSRSFAISGSDGAFELAGLAEGSYQISATKVGFSQKFAGQFPAPSTDLRIPLEARGGVRGKVVDSAGRPVTRFELVLQLMRNDEPAPTSQANSYQSADGSFEFLDIEPGSYALEANAEGFAPTMSSTFFVDRGQAADNVTIQMKAGGGLRGRVVAGTGEPIAGAEVTVNPNQHQNHFLIELFAQFPNSRVQKTPKTRTGRDGTFEFKNLRPETVQIDVKAKNYSSLQKNDVVVSEGVTNEVGVLTLSSGGEIRGRVVDAEGRPFSDGTVMASPIADPNDPAKQAAAAGRQDSKKPDYDGRFSFTNLAPGEWEIQVSPEMLGGQATNPLFGVMIAQQTKQRVMVRDAGVTEVVLRLPPQPAK